MKENEKQREGVVEGLRDVKGHSIESGLRQEEIPVIAIGLDRAILPLVPFLWPLFMSRDKKRLLKKYLYISIKALNSNQFQIRKHISDFEMKENAISSYNGVISCSQFTINYRKAKASEL